MVGSVRLRVWWGTKKKREWGVRERERKKLKNLVSLSIQPTRNTAMTSMKKDICKGKFLTRFEVLTEKNVGPQKNPER